MIKTPIADFLDGYEKSGAARFHMPGHKGRGAVESLDITEIDGAGDLFSRRGIIAESEEIASSLFGCRTYYSTEGSTLAIKTMTSLAMMRAKGKVLAGRNAHRAFIAASALNGFDVEWIAPGDDESYISCDITPERLARSIESLGEDLSFVYITSPDYLGNIADVEGLARVCEDHGTVLLVDCAHGAYLKFLEKSAHPIDLGAYMCASSAHKTLPVLTGGAYLHLSKRANERFPDVKDTMSYFASSSPSYLIMRSLDLANSYLEAFPEKLARFTRRIGEIKSRLDGAGYSLEGDEALKITISAKEYGYTGGAIASFLKEYGVVPEFYDRDFVTFMLSPSNTDEEIEALKNSLLKIKRKAPLTEALPSFCKPRRIMSPREVFLEESEHVEVRDAVGRIIGATVSCPPAVPIAVCGELIDENVAKRLEYYGIEEVYAVKRKVSF